MAKILKGTKFTIKVDNKDAVKKIRQLVNELKKVKRLTLWMAIKLRIAGILK